MADTAIIGKVAVKVIPDTKGFKPKLQSELNKIEKQLKPIKVKLTLNDTEGFKTQVRAVKAEAERALSDIGAEIKPELDKAEKQHVQDELNGMEAEVKVKLSELWRRKAQASLAFLARARSVDLLPKVNKAFASKAALTLAALSGGRSIANIGSEVAEWAGELDKAVPKIAAVSLAVTNLGSSLLTSTSNLLSFSGSLASIGPAALAIPGILGGLTIGVAATVIAFKDFKTQLPGVVSEFSKLKQQISDNFWQKAKAPIQEFVQTLLPQFSAGMRKTSTELGGFFGRLANSFQGVFNNQLGSMFDDLGASIRIASGYTDNFAGIIRTLGRVGAGELPALARWFGDISAHFDRFLRSAERTDALQGWVDVGVHALQDLGSVLANTSSALAGLARAADAAGSTSLHTLATTMQSVARTINSTAFQKTLVSVFEAAHDAMSAIAHEAGPEFRSFIDRLANTLTEVLPKAGSAAGKALGAIFDALDQPVVQKAVVGFFTSLDDVISTLAPAMRPLARALAGIVDLIGGLGKNIARGLAPLIEGLAPQVTDLSRHLLPLTDALGDLLVALVDLGIKGLPSLDGLADILTGLAQAITPIVTAFGSLPGPILQVISSAVLLSLTLPKLSKAFDAAILKGKTFGATMSTAEGRMRGLAAGAQAAAGVAGLGLLTASANTSNESLSALGQIAGTAALGFSVGGPWGAAIGAAVGGFSALASSANDSRDSAVEAYKAIKAIRPVEQARAKLADLRDTLDQVTGAYTGATRAAILQKLQQAGLVSEAAKYGITSRDLVNAALGQNDAMKKAGGIIAVYKRQIRDLNDKLRENADAFRDRAKEGPISQADIDANAKVTGELVKQKKAIQEKIAELKQLPGILKEQGQQVRDDARAVADYSGKLKGIPKRIRTKIDQEGIEPSIRGVAEIAKKYNLLDKREIRTLIKASGADATVKQVQKVIDKMHDVDKVKPNLSSYKASLAAQLDQAGGIARHGGAQVGNAMGQGLNSAVAGWAGSIARTSADLVSNAINAARKAADSHSPSRKMIALGNDMGKGAQIGLEQMTPAVARAGARMAEKLLEQVGTRLGRIKSLFAQNIKAGTDAADKALRHWFGTANSGVNQMVKSFRSMMSELDKAQSKLKSLVQAEKDLRQQTIDSIVSSGDPTQSGATTFAGVESSMQAAILRATRLKVVLKQLRKEGLNKTTLQQILASGPIAGLATAQAIQSMGKLGVDQINKLQKKLQDTANSIGKSTAKAVYKSDIKKAMADVLDLEKQVTRMQARLEKAIQRMIDRLVELLRRNKPKIKNAKDDATGNNDDPKSGSGGGGTGPTSGHSRNRKVSGEGGGVTTIVNNKTLNYYAAEGSSIDSEEDLFAAAGRARMVDF